MALFSFFCPCQKRAENIDSFPTDHSKGTNVQDSSVGYITILRLTKPDLTSKHKSSNSIFDFFDFVGWKNRTLSAPYQSKNGSFSGMFKTDNSNILFLLGMGLINLYRILSTVVSVEKHVGEGGRLSVTHRSLQIIYISKISAFWCRLLFVYKGEEILNTKHMGGTGLLKLR